MGRRKNLGRWLEERRRDHYYKLAKEKGYRSRAAYKLLEVLRKFHFIEEGDKVLDIGAAPGGWTQVAREFIGNTGIVVSVDVKPLRPFESRNIKIINLDINKEEAFHTILELSDGGFNVILSDASPDIIGAWEVDHYRQINLARRVIDLAEYVLKLGGSVFLKLFEGPERGFIVEEVERRFKYTRIIKPKASKAKSSELYILALGFNPSKDYS